MKEFQYDVLLEKQNICNRKAEIKTLRQMMDRRQRVVLYAPRRYGKTSIAKNVIAEDFRASHKKSLVVFANFMDVSGFQSIEDRLSHAITRSIAETFPVQAWTSAIVNYFKNFSISVSIDPLTNSSTLDLSGNHSKAPRRVEDLIDALKKMSETHRVLMILDEFQDIEAVPEALSVFRNALQDLNRVSVMILGSKRKLLNEIFTSSKSPFFNYGDDVTLSPILVDDWLPYFNERLADRGMRIERAALEFLAELLCDVPNAICEAGFWLQHHFSGKVITHDDIGQALDDLTLQKEQTYRVQMALLSEKEKSVLQEIAKKKYITQLASKDFLKGVQSAASATRKIVEKLEDRGLLEWEMNKGYRLSNPMLRYFLARNPL